MLVRSILLPAVIVPTVAAVAVIVLAAVRGRRRGDPEARGEAGLALALAFLTGYVAMTGWPRWVPTEASQRLFFFVAFCGLLAIVAGWRSWRRLPRLVAASISALLLAALLQARVQHVWTPVQSAIAGVILLGVMLLVHRGFAHQVEVSGPWPAAVRMVVVIGTAVALGLSGSALLAQLAGTVACGLGVVEVGTRILGRPAWRASDASVLTVPLVSLVVIGHYYAELALWPAVGLLAAFVLTRLAQPDQPWRTLVPLVPLTIALLVVVTSFLSRPDDPYDYGRATHATSSVLASR